MPLLREDILNPISADNPAGTNFYYDPLMDKIKEARREDDPGPAGEWERELKVADHKLTIKLASELIATKSKDLQVAVWLTESLLKSQGCPGLLEGLTLIKGILEQFWDGCFPEIEDGDLEMRAAPLDWLGARLEVPLKTTGILKNGYNYLQYKDSRTVPTEADAAGVEDKDRIRKEAIADGKLTPEDWDVADKATPNEFLLGLLVNLDACIEALEALTQVTDEKFGNQAPSYSGLQNALVEVRHTIKLFLRARGVRDPKDGDEPEEEVQESETSGDAGGAVSGGGGGPRGITVTGVVPANREEVAIRLEAISKFLRDQDPSSPGPYMMLRGFRWGELRGLGAEPDQRELIAPPTEARQAVKRAFLNQDWAGCLQASETVMAGPGGRAWLDVHRYAVKAAEALGYDLVANAIKNELRSLLADLPELPKWQMLDDSPTANSKTREWLEEIQQEQPVAPRSVPEAPPEPPLPPPRVGRDPFEIAKELVRTGNVPNALAPLTAQLTKETTGRGRFERKAQIAWVLIETGNDILAESFVQECVAQVEAHKLEDWEQGPWLAELLAIFLNCLNRREADYEARTRLYRTIARLDPARALTCSV